MKKVFIACLLLLTIILCFTSYANAQDSVVEAPYINVFVNGSLVEFDDVPLIVNGRTLLPLRELTTSLGVQNDNEHIVWNNVGKRVTIYKDTTEIFMEMYNHTLVVNNKPINMDQTPIIYEKTGKAYVPTRYIAEALGNVVVWDGMTESIFIADKDTFNNVKDILSKLIQSNQSNEKVKADYNISIQENSNGEDTGTTLVKVAVESDKSKNILHADITAGGGILYFMKLNMEFYIAGNKIYYNDFATGSWKILLDDTDDIMSFIDIDDISFEPYINTEVPDIICAFLQVKETGNPDEIVLTAGKYTNELIKIITGIDEEFDLADYDDQFYVELTIDSNTYNLEKVNIIIVDIYEYDFGYIDYETIILLDEYEPITYRNVTTIRITGVYEYNDDVDIKLPDYINNVI
mgnify:CR=1 FL=1